MMRARLLVAALVCLGAVSVLGAQGHQPPPPPPADQQTPKPEAPLGQHAPAAQPPGSTAAPDAHQPATADAAHSADADAAHGETSIWSMVAKIVNFAILVGTLVYFLRTPIAQYLAQRSSQVRRELVDARAMKATATAQLAEVDARLAAIPGELEALRTRGAMETAAEEARIRHAAAAERERLIDQTRREIDAQLRVARRELMEEAATLAVGIARTRLQSSLTPADQLRLVDRYTRQVEQQHD